MSARAREWEAGTRSARERRRERGREGTHFHSQLLIVETALALVRVLSGLISAGYNQGSLLNGERVRGEEEEEEEEGESARRVPSTGATSQRRDALKPREAEEGEEQEDAARRSERVSLRRSRAERSERRDGPDDGAVDGVAVLARDQACHDEEHGESLADRADEVELAAADLVDERERDARREGVDGGEDRAEDEGHVAALAEVLLEDGRREVCGEREENEVGQFGKVKLRKGEREGGGTHR